MDDQKLFTRKSKKKIKCKICENAMYIDNESKSGLCSVCVEAGKIPEYLRRLQDEKGSKKKDTES